MAFGAERLSAVACQHHTVLYLVLIFLHHLEEGVDALKVGCPFPQHPALLVGQFIIGSEDGEAGFLGSVYHHIPPFAHLFAPPAYNGSIIDGQGAVGYHEMLVDADDFPESLAYGTCADGRVEGEHLVVRLLEDDAVRLELGAEPVEAGASVGLVEPQQAGAVSFVHGCLCRVGEAAHGVLFGRGCHTVNQQENGVSLFRLVFVDAHHLTVHFQTGETLLHVYLQLLLQRAVFAQQYRGEHGISGSFRIFQHALHDVFRRMLLHFLSADRAEGFPHTGIEQPQVFVYFGGGAHGGPRIAATNFLLDGNGRRDAFDEIAFGLAHASQELAGVTAQALHVAALPLGI